MRSPTLLRSPVVWAAAAVFTGFFIAASVTRVHIFLEALRLVQVTISAAVMTAYAPIAVDALRSGRPDRVQQLSLGIALGFLGQFLIGSWALLWRLGGQPPWMVNSDVQGLFVFMACLAGVLHVTAPGAIDGVVPKTAWVKIGLAVGLGIFITGVLAVLSPDLAGLTDWLGYYLADPPPYVK